MSQQNVELVLRLQPAPDVDVAQMFRDDMLWAAASSGLPSVLRPDFEAVVKDALHGEVSYQGMSGLRDAWLDWTAPWASYRTEIEDAIDLGDRVVLLLQDFARREGGTQELALNGVAVWTVRDGKIARAEFCDDRGEALRAVGLEE